MKLNYYNDTDSLYIELSGNPSVDSLEVAPNLVIDFDKDQNIVGIDIDHATKHLNLSELELGHMPTVKVLRSK